MSLRNIKMVPNFITNTHIFLCCLYKTYKISRRNDKCMTSRMRHSRGHSQITLKVFGLLTGRLPLWVTFFILYRGSPDSTVFVHPGNRTIAKTVLIGDWFSTKSAIYAFWILKVPFFANFHTILSYWINFALIFTH